MTKSSSDHNDRLEQQYRRLGTRSPMCVVCGERDPFCLELHHIAGQKHHDDVGIVCRNCHRKLTNQQRDHKREQEDTGDSLLATIGHYLIGLCDLLALLLSTLRDFGRQLLESSRLPPA
jgi:hypothetical protein